MSDSKRPATYVNTEAVLEGRSTEIKDVRSPVLTVSGQSVIRGLYKLIQE